MISSERRRERFVGKMIRFNPPLLAACRWAQDGPPAELVPNASQGLGEGLMTRLLLFPPRLVEHPTLRDAEGGAGLAVGHVEDPDESSPHRHGDPRHRGLDREPVV